MIIGDLELSGKTLNNQSIRSYGLPSSGSGHLLAA